MPRRILALVRSDFEIVVRRTRRKLTKAERMYRFSTSSRITRSDYEDWMSIAFQNLVAAWETFLENVFLRYIHSITLLSPNL